MPSIIVRLFRPALLALGLVLLGSAVPLPAAAMCGGNIFMTCPPAAQKAPLFRESRAKPRKRRAAPKTAAR